ncbi:hypothetical protein P171DRAFT_428775 [Karstenula rhodostoma CBS 690.94]|uniref:HypA-like protein n=1 Tax=Karstenula rhodostoma CBS 690.94 TaxID=1392251 RepID=A0A9P4PQW4_9PLEO|nr:hypothetical protein P171DRAFT_428775 [Karstenula rhodostoma CBS 690.94]
MFAKRPTYFKTAAVVASAVGLTAVGINKALVTSPRGLQQLVWKADQKVLLRGMATASTVKLDVGVQPEFFVKGITDESARVTSELLQENHDKHHIFFNRSGFHNHIVHHLLTLFALRATPEEIKRGYNDNKYYQRPPVDLKKEIVDDMKNPERFKTYLGKEQYYHDFLQYFQHEISTRGWETVLNDELFKGDERADDLLARLFGGFLHPIIHLGFGVEFRQPAIIAEALAQAAVHDSWMLPFFLDAEKAANASDAKARDTKTIVQLLSDIRADKKLSSAAHWNDGNKIRDGILKRAPDEMLKYASQYVIDESQLEEKTAEMINAAVFYTAAAQHPPSIPKFDFFFIHVTNASIFFSTFLSLSFISAATKRRLLEWKVRSDLAMYASRASPPLLMDDLTSYESSDKDDSWERVIERVNALPDDGHASKLVRALAHGEQVCKKFELKEGFVVEGDMWRRLGNMAVDSVEAGGPTWVRSTGFEEAWRDVPVRQGMRARV